MDKRHQINLRATSKHAERVVRSNAVATVRGVRQPVGKIKDPHREAKVWLTLQESEDKVRHKADFSPNGDRFRMILICVMTIVATVYAKIETWYRLAHVLRAITSKCGAPQADRS
jgi:hypothetical protein